MGWFSRLRVPKRPTGQVVRVDAREFGIVNPGSESRDFGIVNLGSEFSGKVRELIDKNTLTLGKPFRSGGVLGTTCLPVLGAGSAVTSSLAAGNVFLATANPATLMAINEGVGSAVMGSSGIIAQAPFIAASTAILPVVLPVMFFMTVSSMMMSVQFDRLQSSLDRLADMIKEVLKREVAEDYGNTLSAVTRLQDISSEFDVSKKFTDEMKIRLALVERDLSAMRHKYEILTGERLSAEGTTEGIDSVELRLKMAPINQHLYALSDVASVYADRQRLRLALQDNPDNVAQSVKALNRKVQTTRQRLADLLEKNPLVQYQDELKRTLEHMGWWERTVSQRGRKKTLKKTSELTTQIRADDLAPVSSSMRSWSDSLAGSHDHDEGLLQAVVYYRGDEGKGELKAYYTQDIQLQPEQG